MPDERSSPWNVIGWIMVWVVLFCIFFGCCAGGFVGCSKFIYWVGRS